MRGGGSDAGEMVVLAVVVVVDEFACGGLMASL